jgi:hypothetical protein
LRRAVTACEYAAIVFSMLRARRLSTLWANKLFVLAENLLPKMLLSRDCLAYALCDRSLKAVRKSGFSIRSFEKVNISL